MLTRPLYRHCRHQVGQGLGTERDAWQLTLLNEHWPRVIRRQQWKSWPGTQHGGHMLQNRVLYPLPEGWLQRGGSHAGTLQGARETGAPWCWARCPGGMVQSGIGASVDSNLEQRTPRCWVLGPVTLLTHTRGPWARGWCRARGSSETGRPAWRQPSRILPAAGAVMSVATTPWLSGKPPRREGGGLRTVTLKQEH